MRTAMFDKLVEIIQDYHTWVVVHATNDTATLLARSGTELKPVRRRVLTLVAIRARGVYERGHVWEIPEDRIQRAVRSLKQRDKRFAARWRQSEITRADAEYIIHHASNGFLNLDLDEYKL
jgi:hypothetical protein